MSIDSLRDGFVTLCLNSSLNAYSGYCQMLVEGQYIPPVDAYAQDQFTQNGTDNFVAGDVLVLGNNTLHMVSVIGTTAGNILIAGSFAGTVANIAAALTASLTAGSSTSNYVTPATAANVGVTANSSGFLVQARTAGETGNVITAEYNAAGTVAGSFASMSLTGGTDVQAAVANIPILVNSINDCDALFGAGSILCESLKKVFIQCSQFIQVWALPRPDAGDAVMASYTMTIGGPATTEGVFSLFMLDGEYNIAFPVAAGDSADEIAEALLAALPYNFPYSAVNASGVITFTALNGGTCGNYLAPVYNYLGLQNYAPLGVTVTVVADVIGSGNPAPLNYVDVLGTCCYAVFALLTDDLPTQLALEKFIKLQWACNIPAGFNGAMPQCFGHGYVWNSGTLGEVLATGDNAEVFNRWAQPLNDPNAPYFLVAAYASLTACSACSSPELAVQGPVDGLLTAISRPTTCNEPWSYPARLTLYNAGFVTWGPATNTPQELTNPFVYSDITNNTKDDLDRPNATWQSTTSRRWAANFSNILAQYLDGTFNGLSAFSDGTQIKPGIFGTTRNMMRAKIIAWLNGEAGVTISALQNVDTQVVLTSSLDTSPPCEGIPGNYALTLIVQPPVRINNIATTILPQLFTNCNNTQYSKQYQLANQ
jgi:phage tail sheath gpL-like